MLMKIWQRYFYKEIILTFLFLLFRLEHVSDNIAQSLTLVLGCASVVVLLMLRACGSSPTRQFASALATAGQFLSYGGQAAFTQYGSADGGWTSAGSLA